MKKEKNFDDIWMFTCVSHVGQNREKITMMCYHNIDQKQISVSECSRYDGRIQLKCQVGAGEIELGDYIYEIIPLKLKSHSGSFDLSATHWATASKWILEEIEEVDDEADAMGILWTDFHIECNFLDFLIYIFFLNWFHWFSFWRTYVKLLMNLQNWNSSVFQSPPHRLARFSLSLAVDWLHANKQCLF